MTCKSHNCRQQLLLYLSSCLIIAIFSDAEIYSQSLSEQHKLFQNNVKDSYLSFKNDCNRKYIGFLKSAWEWYEEKTPIPIPKEESPIPPCPYDNKQDSNPISVIPTPILPTIPLPKPKPIEPICEVPSPKYPYDDYRVKFYGKECNIRIPQIATHILQDCTPQSIAAGWEQLCSDEMNNTIRDCLETRIRFNLCDWAYLLFLDQLSRQYCSDENCATLLMSFLYCQSGYQMRLGIDEGRLVLLFGSRHQIYDMGYFQIDGINFYPFGITSASLSICNAIFESETPLSLDFQAEQLLGSTMSHNRVIKGYFNKADSAVPVTLIDFYNSYPTAQIGNNIMSRWAMYANVPLARKTQDILYTSLKKEIQGLDHLTAVNVMLNWVQTGFEYEYDDKVWGHDRAFFAEESLYYPYCDCEDRSILFSRLVRDLLGLDVALIYYPGHLATAVCFDQDVCGDTMLIDGRKFIVCDPTYIGAPVGAQMPNLEYDKVQAIILER